MDIIDIVNYYCKIWSTINSPSRLVITMILYNIYKPNRIIYINLFPLNSLLRLLY